jgi:hypothetical protein
MQFLGHARFWLGRGARAHLESDVGWSASRNERAELDHTSHVDRMAREPGLLAALILLCWARIPSPLQSSHA